MSLADWLLELASLMSGEYDEECNLLVDPGDGLVNSYAYNELVQLYRSNCTPREVVGILQSGGMP